MCRYPFGSGGNRVWIWLYFPVRTSSATTSRIKSEGAGVSIEAVIVIARSYRRTRWRTTFLLNVAGPKCSHVCHLSEVKDLTHEGWIALITNDIPSDCASPSLRSGRH